ncbi:MAG: D-beta-D-heptose 1-phosphate adenylyltransferase [Fimbriimonadaceae bacterium]|nr:D-beta-D-heptose 1-phosphate adenylyltransferase [Fimbriimonadaceae bacterium]
MAVITLEEALRRRHGRRLVTTNGVFDILHVGHVRYLAAAKELGDILFVALNSDDSVRRLGKGPNRPINALDDRAEVVAALRSVDAVLAFDEDTPEAVLSVLKPEVHAKGGDYDPETMPETRLVRSWGGEVVIIPLVAGHSTTRIESLLTVDQ